MMILDVITRKIIKIVMYVVFKTDIEGKINEILLSRNKDWFKPCCWYASEI